MSPKLLVTAVFTNIHKSSTTSLSPFFCGEIELLGVKLTIKLIAIFFNVSRFSTQPRKEIDFTARKTTRKLCPDDLKMILT